MKKAILYLLGLTLCLSFLSGCTKADIYCKTYSNLISANADVLQQMPDYETTFRTHQFWYDSEKGLKNENAPQEVSIQVGDLHFVGHYQGVYPYSTNLSYRPDMYTGNGCSFHIHPDNGQLVYFSGNLPDDTLRALPDLENPEVACIRMAKELAATYVDDLSAYTLESSGKGTLSSGVGENALRYDIYSCFYRRYISDIPTMDYISVSITSKGTIDQINRGEVDAFKNISLDMAAVEESMNNFVQDAWQQYGFTIIKNVTAPQSTYIRLTREKQPAVFVKLRFRLKDPTGVEQTAEIETVTLFSADPDGVNLASPNPGT